MAALFHPLTTPTPAQNGAQAGLPPSSHTSGHPSHHTGNGHGKTFAAMISATHERANNATTESTIARTDGDSSLPHSEISANISGPIIAETSDVDGVSVLESPASLTTAPVAIETPLTDQYVSEEDSLVIAETPDMADIAVIEPGAALASSSNKADIIPNEDSVIAAERIPQTGPVLATSQNGTVPQNAAVPTGAAVQENAVTLAAPNQPQPDRTVSTPATAATAFVGGDGQTLPDNDTAAPSREAAAQSSPASSPAAETAQPSASASSSMAAIAQPDRPATSDETPDAPTPKTERAESAANAERKADNSAATKTAASSTPTPTDLPKVTDAPKMTDAPTLSTANSDPAAPIKTLPVMTSLPPVTPMSALSDRLAATILQTTHAPQPVTLDKVPQAVVAVALSAKSATLQIDPPELGRIQLDYQFDTQGRTVVTLTPESDAARAALIDRMALITASLEQGSNSPVDVKLAEARDFGAAFGQASQDGNGEDARSGSQGGRSQAGSDLSQAQALQDFTRAPAGENGRLHILV